MTPLPSHQRLKLCMYHELKASFISKLPLIFFMENPVIPSNCDLRKIFLKSSFKAYIYLCFSSALTHWSRVCFLFPRQSHQGWNYSTAGRGLCRAQSQFRFYPLGLAEHWTKNKPQHYWMPLKNKQTTPPNIKKKNNELGILAFLFVLCEN